MSKFCHKCGKALKPGVKFCMFCGSKTLVPKKKTVQKRTSERPQTRQKVSSYPTQGRGPTARSTRKETVKPTQKRTIPKRGRFVPRESASLVTKARIKPTYGRREKLKPEGIKEISVDKQAVFDKKLESYVKRNDKLITNLLRRDDYSQTDAVYLLTQFKSLDKLITDRRYEKSKFKNKTKKLYNRRSATLFRVYEYLTEDILDTKLVRMRQGWDGENSRKIEVQELIKFVSELEKQNKLINRDIGRLQEIIDPASRDVISKSRLIREYHDIVLYYDREFEPSKENYTELLMDYSHSEVFEQELIILGKIDKLIDPRGSRSDKFTTYDIYALSNKFIQERGMNAERISLHLNELNEKDKERKEIKRAIKKEYFDYMGVLVRGNRLAIRQPVISRPERRKKGGLRYLKPTMHLSYEQSGDKIPLNAFNAAQPLKKLNSLSSLDDLKPLNPK